MQTRTSLIEIVSSKPDQLARARKIISEIKTAESVDFCLALGATAISDIEGISAAGASAEARRLTPKLDAEALLTGRTASGDPLPSSPAGVTSPVVISRACLSLVPHTVQIVDCGAFVPPDVVHIKTQGQPGKNIEHFDSMDISQVRDLYVQGRTMALLRFGNGDGRKIADSRKIADIQENEGRKTCRLPVLAECVPGGTTTALAVLKALGVKADKLLSSSIPGARDKQAQIVAAAVQRLDVQLRPGQLSQLCLTEPLRAVSFLGDPMQAFAAGFTVGSLEASSQGSGPKAVVLAGGSQMLALYALVRALAQSPCADWVCNDRQLLSDLISERLIVVTTKWVAQDPFGNTASLAELVDAPYVAACPDFKLSRHEGLRAYEDGHVKEGVGAGGSLLLAALLGTADGSKQNDGAAELDERAIITTIDNFYDQIILSSSSRRAKDHQD